MKRCMTLLLALALALALIPCGAVAEGDFTLKIGVLSYLNLTEEEYLARETAKVPALKYFRAHGVLELPGGMAGARTRPICRSGFTTRRTRC